MYDEAKENFRSYKGFSIERQYPASMWVVFQDGKKVFDNVFTQVRLAVSAIDNHLANSAKVVVKKGK